MQSTHTKIRAARPTLSRLRVAIVLMVATLGVTTLTGMAPAYAMPGGRVVANPSVIIRADASTSSAALGSVPYGVVVGIQCTRRGSTVSGNWGPTNLWNRVSYNGRTGFVTDGWLYTGKNGPVAPDCGSTAPAPTPPAPAARRGQTIGYNTGVRGQCTWYVYERARQAIGVYPLIMGNAKDMANNAAARGWTVSTTPRSQTMLVRQPGNVRSNRTYGHVMWVEQVLSSTRVRVADMNVAGVGVITRADVTLVASDRFIYIN